MAYYAIHTVVPDVDTGLATDDVADHEAEHSMAELLMDQQHLQEMDEDYAEWMRIQDDELAAAIESGELDPQLSSLIDIRQEDVPF